MKLKLFLILAFVSTLLFAFVPTYVIANHSLSAQTQPRITKFVSVLKDKKGSFLGKIFIEDFKGDIFNKLLITKEVKGKIDTLYFINKNIFKNSLGINFKASKENYNGLKFEHLFEDSIQLFIVGKGLNGNSDPIIIEWNYKKKLFEVSQEP